MSPFPSILRNTSAQSLTLLGVVFLTVLGMSMLSPFLIASLPDYLEISASKVSLILLWTMIIGSTAALLVSQNVRTNSLVAYARITSFGLIVGVLVILIAGVMSVGAIFVVVFFGLLAIRFNLAALTTVTRAIHVASNSASFNLSEFMGVSTTVFGIGAIGGSILGPTIHSLFGIEGILWITLLVFSCACFITIVFLRAFNPTNELVTRRGVLLYYNKPIVFLLLATVIGGALQAQVFSYIPLSIEGSNLDFETWLGVYLVSNGILLMVLPIPIAMVFAKRDYLPHSNLRAGVLASGASVLLLSHFGISKWSLALSTLFLSVGEVLFAIYGIVALKSMLPNETDIIPKALGVYGFANAAAGYGVGQYLGTWLFETSVPYLDSIVFLGLSCTAVILIQKKEE